jgi:hypothetical protein
MMIPTEYLAATLAGAAIPSQLLVGPAHAWLLLVSVLVVSGGILWFLTGPLDRRSKGRAESHTPLPPRRRRRIAPHEALLARRARGPA